ncbi:MAG: bifunctional 5,10-methylenetetrahydrofolate dehydrogenase/5,10-methenyltetrahydrofolate cyclohydrolase [Candidatus Magasanikbacteria bacterium]
MKTRIIDGKAIAEKILKKLSRHVAQLKKQGIQPKLAVVFVGKNKPSKTYIRRKREAAEKVGIDFALHHFPADISKDVLIKNIVNIQKDKKLNGLIVQLPLPEPLYTTGVLNAIKPELDVDCLTDAQLGKLVMNTSYITPPTPTAVCAILDELHIDPKGKNITIIGAGALVGKPLSIMLSNMQATVTLCNKCTKNIKEKCLHADIIVTAVGKKDLLTADMVKKDAIVIDTGIVFEKGKMYGDVDFKNVSKKASAITPTPGGVGPITVALLLQNVITIAKQKMML